jgi:hypothetical protein
MRRTDRAITDPAEMRAILEKADTCHLALAQDNEPYLVTMNFGLKPGEPLVLYFHAAHEGKKIDWLHRNPTVCFGADVDHVLLIPHGHELRVQHALPERRRHRPGRLRDRPGGEGGGADGDHAALYGDRPPRLRRRDDRADHHPAAGRPDPHRQTAALTSAPAESAGSVSRAGADDPGGDGAKLAGRAPVQNV